MANNRPNDGIYIQTLVKLRQCQRDKGRGATITELAESHPGYTRAALVYHLRRLAEWGCVECIRLSVSKWNRYCWKVTNKGDLAISSGRLPE